MSRKKQPFEETDVPVARSQEMIKRLILENGGTGVAFISEPPQEGFQCKMPIGSATYTVRMKARSREGHEPGKEERRIWRVLFWHLKDIFDCSRSGVLEFRELILPFVVTDSGRTIAEHVLPRLDAALAAPSKLLPGGEEE